MSDLSPEERAMFRRARHDFEPNASQRDRNARALAGRLGISAGTLAGGLSAGSANAAAGAVSGAVRSAGSSLISIAGKWLAVGLLVGPSTVSGVVLLQKSPKQSKPASGARVEPRPAIPVAALASGAGAPLAPSAAPLPPVEAPPNRTALPHPTDPGVSNRDAQAEPLTPPGHVNDEARLLRRADRALQSGSASHALELLDELALRFPDGVLTEERSTERVLTLCQLGRVAQARQEAARFLRATPSSPLVSRVTASCAGPLPSAPR